MNFLLKIIDINCRIIAKDKAIVDYLKNKLDYSAQLYKPSVEIIIRRNDHELEFVGRPLKIKFTMPYNKNINLGFIDYITRSLLGQQLLVKNILLFHASAVIKNESAYVFMGPSTAGKTTIMSYFDTKKRLADDTSIVKKIKKNFFVYSSPFDFKRKINAPKKYVPLKKIFLLKKSTVTRLKKMSSKEQIVNLIENSFSLPKVDNRNDRVDQTNRNLDKVYYKMMMDLLGEVGLSELHFKKNQDFINLI